MQRLGIAAERIVHLLPAFNLHSDDVAVGQQRLAYLPRVAKWHTAMKRILCTVQPRQAREADILLDQKAVSLGIAALANQVRRRDLFGERVRALEALTMVCHHFAGAPQVIQSQRAVLTTAIALRSCPCRHFEVAVAHHIAFAQDGPHFDDCLGVFAGHGADTRIVVALPAHDHAPMWQLVHRPGSQPAPPIEELALLVGHFLPLGRHVIEHPAVQRDVVAARNDLQRVQLQVLYRLHGLFGPFLATPTSARP